MVDIYNSASFLLVASAYSSSKVYAIKPTDGSGDISFTPRGTLGFRINSSSLIEQVNSDTIRLDYTAQPTRTNLLLYSNDFSAWGGGNSSVTSSAIISPDGTLNGWKLNESVTIVEQHYVVQQNILTPNLHTFSIFAKAAERHGIRLAAYGTNPANNFTNYPQAVFNISASGGSVLYSNNCSASIQSYSNGWYRCTIQSTTILPQDLNTKEIVAFFSTAIGTSDGYAGSIGSGIYVYGAQLELTTTSSSTPYIPTTATTASAAPSISCPSFLFETQRTNLLSYSNTFSNGVWTFSAAEVTASVTTSPSGTLDGWKINEQASNTTHSTRRNGNFGNLTAGSTYIYSAFVKPADRTAVAFETNIPNAYDYTKFNLIGTGSIISTQSTLTASISLISNGWYRISVKGTANHNGAGYYGINILSGSSYAASYTGETNRGVYIYGAQIETGSYLTSYIPTTAATFTRNGDYPLSIPTSSDPYNFTILHVGTFEANEINAGASIQITSGSNNIAAGFLGTTGIASWNSGSGFNSAGTNVSTGSEHKMLLRFSNNSLMTWFVDGVKIYSQSFSIANPSWDRLILNKDIAGLPSVNEAPVRYRIVAVIPSALSDADCITLTT